MKAIDLARELNRIAVGVETACSDAVTDAVQTIERDIKHRQGTPPAPNVITGDYRRSWTHQVHQQGNTTIGEVYTNKPQARRLEYGFMDMRDRLGRLFHQKPRPHVQPALDAATPEIIKTLEGKIDAVIK